MNNDQQSMRKELYNLLGDLPEPSSEISTTVVSREQHKEYVLEKLILDLNGIEPVPAYFVYPATDSEPFPVILYNHAHGGEYILGKDELIKGRRILHSPPYAEALTARGIAALCIDAWCFGERSHATESELFKKMLWNGQVMWGMMVYDSLRALKYLRSRPDIDRSRIGTLGMSMGSTMAWWVAALDTEVKVCVDICCLTDFHTLIETVGLDLHGVYYYVPGLLKKFSTSLINSLIAPRPHLSVAGIHDPLTPVRGLDRIDNELRRVYGVKGAEGAWSLKRYECGHEETAEMRRDILAFLDTWL